MINIPEKIYCLVTPLNYILQQQLHSLKYGFTAIGDKIFRYFINDNMHEISGYFMDEHTHCDFDNIMRIMEKPISNYSAIISNCKIMPLVIKDLIIHKKMAQQILLQSFILDASQIKIVDNHANINGEDYTVTGNIFSYKNLTTFFGFTQDQCTISNLSYFLWDNLISTTPCVNINLEHTNHSVTYDYECNATKLYFNHPIKHDNVPYKSIGISAIILSICAGVGIGYVINKAYHSYSIVKDTNTEVHNLNPGEEELSIVGNAEQ